MVATATRRQRRAARGSGGRRVDLATRQVPRGELGDAGIAQWGGVMSELDVDYAAAWQLPTNRWTTTDRMQADAAVSACLAALTFPVLAAELRVEPASDAPEDQPLADFIEAGLNNMTTGLQRHRAETLGMVGEGVRLFEIEVEQREDQLYHLRKLALRPNKSVQKWHTDDTGGPDGVTQMRAQPAGTTARIHMDRLLAFTHMGDGPSLLGRPALRAMYRPWYLLDKISRVGAIAIERHGVGVPWARYSGGDPAEAARIDHALMALHASERLFFRMGSEVPDWGIKGVEGQTLDPVPFMEYQRRDLFLASLAQFLALGTDGVGSLALSSDHTSFFMLALRFIAGELEDVYNRHLIPRWVGYNWTVPADRMPRVVHGTIDQRNALQWAQSVAAMVQAGVPLPPSELSQTAGRLLGITIPEVTADDTGADDGEPDATLLNGLQVQSALEIMGRYGRQEISRIQAETALRGFLALDAALIPGLLGEAAPAASSGGADVLPGVTDVNDPNAPETAPAPVVTPSGLASAAPVVTTSVDLAGRRLESEVKLEALGVVVDFAGMAAELDAREAAIIGAVGKLQAKQAKRLTAIGKRLAGGGTVTVGGRKMGGDELVAALLTGAADGADLAAQERLVPFDEEAAAFEEAMLELYWYGSELVARELDEQGIGRGETSSDREQADRARIHAAAVVAGTLLADRMQNAWAMEMTARPFDAERMATTLGGLGSKLLGSLASARSGLALGMGRLVAILNSDATKVMYSAINDRETCGDCRDKDGKEYPVEDAPEAPNAGCAGNGRCRCELVPLP